MRFATLSRSATRWLSTRNACTIPIRYDCAVFTIPMQAEIPRFKKKALAVVVVNPKQSNLTSKDEKNSSGTV
jgi:hypothetical protein